MKGKKILRLLTGKFFIICLMLVLEILLIPGGIVVLTIYFNNIWLNISVVILIALAMIAGVISVSNSEINAEYKTVWMLVVCGLPVLGPFLYFILHYRKRQRPILKNLQERFPNSGLLYVQNIDVMKRIEQKGDLEFGCARLVLDKAYMPATDATGFEYYTTGEEYAARFLEELRGAEKFIFLETFIIGEGQFWTEIRSILKERAAAGVDVRLIYDDIGSMGRVERHFIRNLEQDGIHAICFNPFRPVVDAAINNRDHRKISVIDGKCAFTGGLNFADEYLNITHPHGKWKDSGILLRGRVVQNFTAMFLQLWLPLRKENEDLSKYLSDAPEGDILCTTFTDYPVGRSTHIAEDLYLKLIYGAKKYIHITSPYLVIDGELKRAIITAAHSGVEVSIIVPAIPDKKFVYSVTKAFYTELAKKNVKIYRYTPGFIHAKGIVCDGKTCILGSTNTDLRSFYLHFECDAVLFDERISAEVEKDFQDILPECERVDPSEIRDGVFRRLGRSFLRIFAPLL